MFHLITGYAGYEHIQSADDGAFNAALVGGGQYVMEMGNKFAASIIDNNTVRLLDGDGMMFGRYFRIEPNSYEDITITTGTAGLNRIDLICATYKKNEDDGTETVYPEVIKGKEASTATMPNYTTGNILNGAVFNQMPLYKCEIEGVVLKRVVPLLETIPTFVGMAEKAKQELEQKVNQSYDNLMKKNEYGSDIVGVVAKARTLELPLVADADTATGIAFKYDANTLHTPYKQSNHASFSTEGIIFNAEQGNTGWNTQLCMPKSSDRVWVRSQNNSVWSAWQVLLTLDDYNTVLTVANGALNIANKAMPMAGGTITENGYMRHDDVGNTGDIWSFRNITFQQKDGTPVTENISRIVCVDK